MEICVNCPHCNNIIIIYKNEINCNIFRHGVVKTTMKQMDPHSSKEFCDNMAQNGEIYGCGKPFTLVTNNNNDYKAISCDYI
jgi:hypothetical protein